jgi:hypothetical protein
MKLLRSIVPLVFVGLLAASAWGQSTANLSGTVSDPTGAVVPGAHVTVHSLATGADRNVTTDGAGLYSVPSLQPGDYSVKATATGFSTYSVQKLTLLVAQSETLNMKLPLESAGTTVQVEGSAASQIETQTITVGQVIDPAEVHDLPLNGRHFLDLTVLTPGGVVAPTSGSLTASSRGLGSNAFITAGNREDSINFQINGINLNDIDQNQITFQPSISTTGEFKVDNSTFSAEYGLSDGSIVTIATKSGTNQFHGEVFDYFRNEALDARNYFNRDFSPATGLAIPGLPGRKAPLKRNNFGVTVGGPVWRNHTFFTFSYEGLRQHQGLLQNSPVLSNAASTSVVNGVTTYFPNQRAAVVAAGNATANALLAYIPLPNSGNNYVAFTPGPVQIDQYTGDILQEFSSKDSLHGFYAYQKDVRTEPALQGDTVPGWGDHRAAHRQIGTLSETHIFSPTLVNEVRLGFNRITISFNPANTLDPTSVGIQDGLSGPVGIPQTSLSDIGLTFGGPSGFPQGRSDTTGVLADTVTKVAGRHQFKLGGEFRRYLIASFGGNIGAITQTSSQTTSTISAADAQTKTQADLFEQGMTTVFSGQPNIVSSRVYANSLGLFAQDNFKLNPRLTLEYGLRYEWNGTPVEGENRFSIFFPSQLALVRVGTYGLTRNAEYAQNFNVEPRLGFALDVFGTGKTVVRGAYGYLVDQPVAGVAVALASNPPFSSAVSYNNSSTPIPLSSLYAKAASSGISLAYDNPHFHNAYVEDFNLNVQQALPFGMVGSIYYVGSTGHHLQIETNTNQVVGSNSLNQVHPLTTLAANSPIDPGGAIASNIGERNSIGYSNYNALWLVLSKNMSHGLQFNMNYEWSKSMDINSLGSQGGYVLPDSNNPSENYGLSDFDVRNHFAGTGIYNLPFHRNRFVSGYQLTTIVQYQTGNPVNITAGSDGFNGITGLIRPNLLGPILHQKQQLAGQTNVTYIQNPTGSVCTEVTISPACNYEVPQGYAPGTTTLVYNGLGNAQRNAGIGPGFADVDLSGEKETKIFEGLSFTLRADAFDILNHPNFNQPSGNVQSTLFGQITSTRFATSDGGSSRQLQISGTFHF